MAVTKKHPKRKVIVKFLKPTRNAHQKVNNFGRRAAVPKMVIVRPKNVTQRPLLALIAKRRRAPFILAPNNKRQRVATPPVANKYPLALIKTQKVPLRRLLAEKVVIQPGQRNKLMTLIKMQNARKRNQNVTRVTSLPRGAQVRIIRANQRLRKVAQRRLHTKKPVAKPIGARVTAGVVTQILRSLLTRRHVVARQPKHGYNTRLAAKALPRVEQQMPTQIGGDRQDDINAPVTVHHEPEMPDQPDELADPPETEWRSSYPNLGSVTEANEEGEEEQEPEFGENRQISRAPSALTVNSVNSQRGHATMANRPNASAVDLNEGQVFGQMSNRVSREASRVNQKAPSAINVSNSG